MDPDFFQVMDDVGEMLREVYHTSNAMTLPLSATGTGGMEAACANILEHGDTMIVCRNGYFGARLADIAERCGAEVHIVDAQWGKPVTLEDLAAELQRHPRVKAVGVVHGETSTGVLTPLEEIVDLAHRHGALVIVDAVTSLGSHDIRLDDWDIDVSYSASQKCLGAPPGLVSHQLRPSCHGGRQQPYQQGAELLLQHQGPGKLLVPSQGLPPHLPYLHDLRLP